MPKDSEVDPTEIVGGLALGRRVQAGEKLRPPARSDSEHENRLVSGEAWRDFCRTLERAGEHILASDLGQDPRSLAGGFRYLLGLLPFGIQQARELGDPDYPTFARIQDLHCKWGAENADNSYLQTHVRGDRSYRIRGERGSCMEFLIESKEGYMQFGDTRTFSTLCASELEVGPDGSFEVIASAEEHPGNWLPLHPDARQITIRQYFWDWENEQPAHFEIECVGREGLPPEPLEARDLSRLLDDAGHWVEMTEAFWSEWFTELRENNDPQTLAPARRYVGGADDIRYGNDSYELEDDEAIVLEVEPPDARYWHFQLCSQWFHTMDFANRSNSLNGHQLHIDTDGRCRVVIAHRDPGVPNWLDTVGDRIGMIQYRWVWTRTDPVPVLKRVRFGDIRAALPSDTPVVTPEQRREQIRVRQQNARRRFRL
ncbi:MAG: DUF1214 domain-containing protein [Proteobacteria bacterium]|nr:DUF1214 domain-containing protein [Pseudomonadota bacterium]